jgi:branched-chain amino acid transport system ATP-binding protein
MLTVENLSVRYGHIHAVREASLTVEPGEIVAILGANGAGKSSLLKAIVGLEPVVSVGPNAGTVSWRGQRLDQLSAHQVAHTGVALVPEGRQILPTMSVRDNLLLGGYKHHTGHWRDLLGPISWLMRDAGLQERMDRVFRLFPRLEERQGQMAGSLSGGEQQMLATGRALMASPELLLLDEPSIGLAPNLVRDTMQLLVGLRQEGLTILLVEQDAHAALRIADRGYVMETGRVVADGTAKELLASPRMRRAYLGIA